LRCDSDNDILICPKKHERRKNEGDLEIGNNEIPCLLLLFFSEACDVRNAGLGYDTTKKER